MVRPNGSSSKMPSAMQLPTSHLQAQVPPLNINTATMSQLMPLPGVGPFASRIIAARSGRQGLFKSWADLQARVTGISERALARLQGSGITVVIQFIFDPVTDLPSDLAALCLSFLDARSLLDVAQLVSRAWRDAIDGSLPAVWHCVELPVMGPHLLEEIACRARGSVRDLRGGVDARQCIRSICCTHSFYNLQHLDLQLPMHRQLHHRHGGLDLSCFPLLRKVSLSDFPFLLFPPLRFLTDVRCDTCPSVRGINNLPALKTLDLQSCFVDDDVAWPASISDVTVFAKFDPRLFDLIAALPQLTNINICVFSPDPRVLDHRPNFDFWGALQSLREVVLYDMDATDQELQMIVSFTTLQSLTLHNASAITSRIFEHVRRSPNLTKLSVSRCHRIADYSPVGLCVQLRHLHIRAVQQLSVLEVEAISQLQGLEKLELVCFLVDPSNFSLFCSLPSLRELHTPIYQITPVSALSSLPSLRLLESITLPRVQSAAVLAVYLAQMPKLRHITLSNQNQGDLSDQDWARLRDHLPRLESVEYAVSVGI